ncbi:alpha/beta hydrolase [Sinomonas sp. ASV486]|uniref:alpha/beta fold hydrolase n=1 Tax=Sinomonas sp. ASV486 TaxID=3051170 RepID=UPI0027DD2E31|nr:alpha/beta hydrolase [Sinomonas sp. ASV486]MDQ4490032.1 alpha/beta hydrolase [Sinomonas sp. ASV486]
MGVPELQGVNVGGLTIAYRRAGTGAPLVLLHGAYEDSRIWERQLADLSDEFTVIAWDAPGCGGSDDLPPDFAGSLGLVLDGLLAALGLTGERRPHVLGLSFGSTVALDLVGVAPQAAQTLILASAYAGWAGSLPPEEVDRRYAQVLAELDRPATEIIPAWLPTLFTERATPAMCDLVSRVMADFRPSGMRALLELAGRADYRPVLPTISVPTLLLYGSEDARSPVSVGEALRAQIPGAALEVLPGVGHLSFIEDPHAFDGAVRRWVRAHLGASQPDGR